uniref:Alpha-ketoglutarate-dependent dioxygenase AlkB-like domain-containing protein n=1 Tax=Timema bartmani TaxID=61472 RepID=A0A7R9FA14_9NEOP|nr:unnamed protein product [Timema bartmani]
MLLGLNMMSLFKRNRFRIMYYVYNYCYCHRRIFNSDSFTYFQTFLKMSHTFTKATLTNNGIKTNWDSYMSFSETIDNPTKEQVIQNMLVIENFLSEEEELSLFKEVEPYMDKLHYEFDHWDDAIHGFRETERLMWNENNMKILQKVREVAFPSGSSQLSLVHVLDLAEKGFIKPHVDSVRFCGNTITGLSLLSDSVMRLVHEKKKENIIDVLLRRRSLYIMNSQS